jgi:hypothetical protein
MTAVLTAVHLVCRQFLLSLFETSEEWKYYNADLFTFPGDRALCSTVSYFSLRLVYDISLWRFMYLSPIRVSARSKAWSVFPRSKTGLVGSNPTRGMDVCLRLFCVCVVLCAGSGLATGLIPHTRSPTNSLRNWSETKRFTDALCSSNRNMNERMYLSF